MFFLMLLAAIVLLYLAFAAFYRPTYNSLVRTDDEAFMHARICMEISIGELAIICNIMHDIQREAKRPFFMRLFRYPRCNPEHTDLSDKLIKKILVMKDLYEINKSWSDAE